MRDAANDVRAAALIVRLENALLRGRGVGIHPGNHISAGRPVTLGHLVGIAPGHRSSAPHPSTAAVAALVALTLTPLSLVAVATTSILKPSSLSLT